MLKDNHKPFANLLLSDFVHLPRALQSSYIETCTPAIQIALMQLMSRNGV